MKKNILWVAAVSVFVILFNVIFFMALGFTHPKSVWISYGFIHFAYVMMFAVRLFKRNPGAIYEMPLNYVSVVYFIVEFIVGMIFIYLRSDGFKLALSSQLILAGIYIVVLFSIVIANENTADSLEKQQKEVFFIKSESSRVKLLMGRLNDKNADRAVERVYDMLHASPTASSPEVYDLEALIQKQISMLQQAVVSDDSQKAIALSRELEINIGERNRRVQLTRQY